MPSIRRFDKIDAAPGDPVVGAFNLRLLDPNGGTEALRLFGWMQPAGTSQPGLVVVQGDRTERFAACDPRPDVAERIGPEASVNCGFQASFTPQGDEDVDIFAAVGDTRTLIGRIWLGTAEAATPLPPPPKAGRLPGAKGWLVEVDTGPPPVSHKAVRGKKDFLFLGGADSNGLIEHMSGKTAIGHAALDIHDRNFAVIDALTCPHIVVVVPEAHIVYEELLPDGVTVSQNRPIKALLERHGASVWYPLDLMRELKAKGETVYTGHDSHWTEFASFPVYAEMRRRLGRDFPMATLRPSHLREVRDLRITSRDEVVAREQEARKNALGATYRLFFAAGILNHGNLSALFNPNGRGRLLAFGTSFSTRLVPAYASDFREVVFAYGTTVDPLLIEMTRPDAVIVEMPERFVHFPSTATPGSMLLSSLIASRAEGYKGLGADNLAVMTDGVPDTVLIARDLVLSLKEPARLDAALKLLAAHDPAAAARAAAVAAVLPRVSNPPAFRSVVSGQYMNGFAMNTLWNAIDAGELAGVDPDIFPDTEMGLLARMRLDLRAGRRDEAAALLDIYRARFGESDFSRRMADMLAR